jgi:hypothetical protein
MIPVPETHQVDLVFPARGSKFAPPWDEIPEKFKRRHPLKEFFQGVFFQLIDIKTVEMIPREGVEAQQAWDALCVVLGNRELQQEHKEAAFAMLSHEWFDMIAWTARGGEKRTFAAERAENESG